MAGSAEGGRTIMHDVVTTFLDVIGLLLCAAGAGVAAGRVAGWSAMAVSGVIVLAASWWAARHR